MRPSSVPPAALSGTSFAIWAASSTTPSASCTEWETITRATPTYASAASAAAPRMYAVEVAPGSW